MKDEATLKEVINTLSEMTGRPVSKEQEEKIEKEEQEKERNVFRKEKRKYHTKYSTPQYA